MLTRRHLLAVLAAAAVPSAAQAAVCQPVFAELSLCDARGWTIERFEGRVAFLAHTSGIAATIELTTGLTEDELAFERWSIGHAPISARAEILQTDLVQLGSRLATTVAYRPRHADPVTVVALSDIIGPTYALVLTTQDQGADTYSDTHKAAHAGLLGALQLDLPE